MRLSSLRAKLIAVLVSVSVAFTLITTATQVYGHYRDTLRDIEGQLDAVEQFSMQALSSETTTTALSQQDLDQFVKNHLQTILLMPAIQGVSVYQQKSTMAQIGKIPAANQFISRKWPLASSSDIHLEAYASIKPLHQQLLRDAGTSLLSNSIRTLVAALMVLICVERLVIRPVREVARHIQSNTPGSNYKPLHLSRNFMGSSDELDELVQSVNQLQTSLNQHQLSLQQEKNRYFALFDNNPEAIWRCELQSPLDVTWPISQQINHLLNNATAVEINAAGKKFCNTQTTLPGFVDRALWQTLAEKEWRIKDYLSQGLDRNGQEYYVSSSIAAIIDNNLCQTIWGVSIEITARMQMQQALQDREQQLQASQVRLAEAQALAHMGHWDYRTFGDDLFVSDEFSRIYGFKPQDPSPTWADLIERIHPDDRQHITHTLSSVDSEAVGAEHRIIWPNGEERHVQAVARKRIKNNRVEATFGILLDITDRRRAEDARRLSQQALIESEARMAEAQALAHMGHWILDYKTKQFTCSDEFYRLYGHKPGAFPPHFKTFNEQIHPEDRERIETSLTRVRSRPISENFRIIRPDGEICYLRASAIPFYSGGKEIERVFGISIDVTEQTKTELALQASQELVSTAFKASPDGIAFIHSESLKIIDSNPTFQRISGFSDEELKQQPIDILKAHRTTQDGPMQLAQMLKEKHQVNDWEIDLHNKQGDKVNCLVSWRTVKLHNQHQKFVFLHDVTQLRQLEKTNLKQTKQLLQADKLASIGTMVAGVAHEINNPNHIIQMNTDLLTEFNHQILELLEELPAEKIAQQHFNGLSLNEISETMPQLFDDIKSCTKRIARIVRDLKDFAQPRERAEYLPLDLNHVIEQSLMLLAPALENKSVQLNLDLHPLPNIAGDSQQLQQIIVNLTMNAIDAYLPGDNETVTINSFWLEGENQVVCEILDQGCGIASEYLDQIFDPFFTTKQERGGTGLGLAISFQLVREHRGTFEVKSKIGEGTKMRITFPALATADNFRTTTDKASLAETSPTTRQ